MYDIGVIGLGYVGLTLAVSLADCGFRVLGCERRADVVDLINRGEPHFSETGMRDMLRYHINRGNLRAERTLAQAGRCPVYVITVGTPLDSHGRVRVDFIKAATQEVAKAMPEGTLVILRSTVKIGTSRKVVAPILAASGKAFDLAMCPERTLEGTAMEELRRLPQIIGADTEEVRERAADVFRRVTRTIVKVSSLEAAEIVKLVDNTFRDVQFGYGNEVARICDAYGANVMDVIDSCNLGYPRNNVAFPGLVGGPCLSKDPHILAQSLEDVGLALDIAPAARRVNEHQVAETLGFIVAEAGRRRESPPSGVALLGMAFKGIPATDDLRGAMSLGVFEGLKARWPDTEIRIFDPVCSAGQLRDAFPTACVASSIDTAIKGASVAIIANNHPHLRRKNPLGMLSMMADKGFIYDYWNLHSIMHSRDLAPNYFAVGNTAGGT